MDFKPVEMEEYTLNIDSGVGVCIRMRSNY